MTAGKKSNQSKPIRRRRSTERAGCVASGLVTRALRAKGFAQAEVVTRWAHIVGPQLSESTVPLGLKFPRSERFGGTLTVRCESAFAPLLAHKTQQVIERVNSYFGYQAVAKLDVKQGPIIKKRRKIALEKQPLLKENQDHLNSIVGEGELSPLQEAVKSLGEHVLSGTKNPNDQNNK